MPTTTNQGEKAGGRLLWVMLLCRPLIDDEPGRPTKRRCENLRGVEFDRSLTQLTRVVRNAKGTGTIPYNTMPYHNHSARVMVTMYA